MINWPLAADYSMMLQNPQVAFKATEFRRAKIERDGNNQPRGLSGAFAVVYHATLPNGRDVAVRAFTSPNSERAQRYDAISAYLRKHRQSEYLVDFEYSEKGIRAADGKFYPLLTMEWIAGDTLYDWVHGHCVAGDRKNLQQLVEKWVALIEHLEAAQIAHGDLQHGNILVSRQRELKLVDYDCMCVPGLVGLRNLEIGVDPYQHPARNCDTRLTLDLDRFSAIVIFVALRALQADPALWREFVVRDSYDKLLFRRSDFEQPGGSRLRQALAHSSDKEVPHLFDDLTQLYRTDISSIPALREFLFSFDTVRSLLSRRHYDEAVELVSRNTKPASIPADLRGPLSEAKRCVNCRKRIADHVAAGDEASMARDYVDALLADYPAAKDVAEVAKHAKQVVQILKAFNRARSTRHVRGMVQIWDRHAQLLRTRKSCLRLQKEVEDWRGRNQTCDRVLKILAADNGYGDLKPLWSRLQAGGGHPDLDSKRAEIDHAIARWDAWVVFQRIPDDLTTKADRRRISAWQRHLFAGWQRAEARRPAVENSRQRLSLAQQIDQLAKEALSLPTEQRIVVLAKSLPKEYDSAVRERSRLAASRLSTLRRLRAVVASDTSEAQLADLWRQLQNLGCQSLLEPKQIAPLELAAQRAPLIARLKQLPRESRTLTQDKAILEVWTPAILDDCTEAEPWSKCYRRAVERHECLDCLRGAINAGEDEETMRWGSHPCLKDFDVPPELQHPVQDAAARLKRVQDLCEDLVASNRERFRREFDAQLIRKFPGKFAPFQQQLLEFARAELCSPHCIGLKEAVVTSSVVQIDRSGRSYRLRWSWPRPQVTRMCVVGLTAGSPKAGIDPRKLPLLFRDVVYRENYESAGGCRIIHPDPKIGPCQVFVWAIIDLGFAQLASDPLLLGRLKEMK